VQRDVEELQAREDHGDGQRQGQADGDRGADAHEEHEHEHDDREGRRQVAGEIGQALAGVLVLIEDHLETDARRQFGAVGVDLLEAAVDPQVDAPAGLHDRADDDGAAALGEGESLRRIDGRAGHGGDVGDAHEAAVALLAQRDRRNALDGIEFAADLHEEVLGDALKATRGDLGVGGGDARGDVVRRQADGGEGAWIDLDADLFLHLAVQFRLLRARQVRQTHLQVLGEAREQAHLGLARSLPDEGCGEGHGEGAADHQIGPGAAGGQQRFHLAELVAHLGPDHVRVRGRDAVLEFDVEVRVAGAGARPDGLDLRDLAQRRLEALGDEGFDPLGGGAGQEGVEVRVAFGHGRVFLPTERLQGGEARDEHETDGEAPEATVPVEEVCRVFPGVVRQASVGAHRAATPTTTWPGTMRCVPVATMRSPSRSVPCTKTRSRSVWITSTRRRSVTEPSAPSTSA
jgi:hypothetical protein